MFKQIWTEENIDLWVRPYQIVCLSNDSGLIEPILNTVSLHQIKKNSNKSLREYFMDEYGGELSENFKSAQRNFMQSCAAYSLISYLLQVKDRWKLDIHEKFKKFNLKSISDTMEIFFCIPTVTWSTSISDSFSIFHQKIWVSLE